MRAIVIVTLLALAWPTFASAQDTQRGRGRDITRDQYIETAKQRAASRFDKADTNKDGVLSADERRAARAKRQPAASPQ